MISLDVGCHFMKLKNTALVEETGQKQYFPLSSNFSTWGQSIGWKHWSFSANGRISIPKMWLFHFLPFALFKRGTFLAAAEGWKQKAVLLGKKLFCLWKWSSRSKPMNKQYFENRVLFYTIHKWFGEHTPQYIIMITHFNRRLEKFQKISSITLGVSNYC